MTADADERLPVMGGMSHTRIGHPYPRVRRWARHTPNGTIALYLIASGVTLIFLAVVLFVTVV